MVLKNSTLNLCMNSIGDAVIMENLRTVVTKGYNAEPEPMERKKGNRSVTEYIMLQRPSLTTDVQGHRLSLAMRMLRSSHGAEEGAGNRCPS